MQCKVWQIHSIHDSWGSKLITISESLNLIILNAEI